MRIDEVKSQAAELVTLIESLRPSPFARLISREELRLVGAMSGDEGLIELAERADPPGEHTLFWQNDGVYAIQVVLPWEEQITG